MKNAVGVTYLYVEAIPRAVEQIVWPILRTYLVIVGIVVHVMVFLLYQGGS